ncbi:MAG: ThiF family adenylyltransferase [Candidatus Aenigmatarchaeota archaeon]|nr:MAG: ThiF family adenylyltransferase [Candidatus Aenigmarchaeota archaeon]
MVKTRKEAVIVGAGAIGTRTAGLLTRAGASVRVIDRDFIDDRNLERQKLYNKNDVGKAKALVVAERLGIEGVVDDVNANSIGRLLGKPDVVLDCTDNMAARFLLNDYCLANGVLWVYAGAVQDRGIVMAFSPEGKPCLRCLIPREPGPLETCDTVGIDNETASRVAALQTEHALKGSNGGTLIDISHEEITKTDVPPRKNCPACAQKKYEYLERTETIVALCAKDAYHMRLNKRLDLPSLDKTLSGKFKTKLFDGVLHVWPDARRISLFASGRAIVEAKDEKEARSRLARFVGV